MTLDDWRAALALPPATRVGQRVPKKMLLEHGAPTTADKRVITDGIEELQWFASLKPATIGVQAYRDEVREYLEIVVLGLNLRLDSKIKRLLELVHRAVPYPVVLLVHQGNELTLSLCHKRHALNEAAKTVLDGDPVEVTLGASPEMTVPAGFQQALAWDRQPRADLWALYQGWMDTLLAQRAAALTGAFMPAASPEHAALRHDDLRRYEQLADEIGRLRKAAARESQVARQVQLNLQIQRALTEQADLLQRL